MKLFHVNPQTDFLSECAGAFDAAPQLAVVTWQMGLQMALKVTLPVASERTNLEGKIRKGLFKKNQASIKLNCKLKVAKLGTLDLSEFNVNVMTGNNEAYQRSPYYPVIQKGPFFYVQTPEFFSLQ